jgi:hypothetical protein
MSNTAKDALSRSERSRLTRLPVACALVLALRDCGCPSDEIGRRIGLPTACVPSLLEISRARLAALEPTASADFVARAPAEIRRRSRGVAMKAVNLFSAIAGLILITAGLAVFVSTHNDPRAAGVPQSSSVAAPATASLPSVRPEWFIDFNDPTTLAWSLELGGTPAGAPHDVSCTNTTGRIFACTGLTPDQQKETEEVTVSPDGSSWATALTT